MGMHDHQQSSIPRLAHGHPAFFGHSGPFIGCRRRMRVLEHRLGRSEIDAVFSQVARRLGGIPLEMRSGPGSTLRTGVRSSPTRHSRNQAPVMNLGAWAYRPLCRVADFRPARGRDARAPRDTTSRNQSPVGGRLFVVLSKSSRIRDYGARRPERVRRRHESSSRPWEEPRCNPPCPGSQARCSSKRRPKLSWNASSKCAASKRWRWVPWWATLIAPRSDAMRPMVSQSSPWVIP